MAQCNSLPDPEVIPAWRMGRAFYATDGIDGDQIASSAMEASTSLRMWRRHRSRALELGATLPDVLLQVRALDVIVQGVLKLHPQTQFRVATYRMEAGIDERPTDDSLSQFLELLTAEMDNLQTSSTTPTNSTVEKADKSKADSALKTMRPTLSATCRYWGTDAGCKQGKACKYPHPQLPDARDRCWNCSSIHHQKIACPYIVSKDGNSADSGGKNANQKGSNQKGHPGIQKGGVGAGGGRGQSGFNGGKNDGKGKRDGKGEVQKDDQEKPQDAPKVASVQSEEKSSTGDGEWRVVELGKLVSSMKSPPCCGA